MRSVFFLLLPNSCTTLAKLCLPVSSAYAVRPTFTRIRLSREVLLGESFLPAQATATTRTLEFLEASFCGKPSSGLGLGPCCHAVLSKINLIILNFMFYKFFENYKPKLKLEKLTKLIFEDFPEILPLLHGT